MTTQPAGEHHTGSLNLTGQGNAADALQTLINEWRQSADEDERYLNRAHASEIHDVMASIRINREHADALEAAYPAIWQHVAEQIAAKLTARRGEITPGRPGWGYLTEAIDITNEIGGQA